MADYDLARQAMELLGDYLYEKGIKQPRETIEGNNAVGNAIREGRDRKAMLTQYNYLKGLASDSKKMPDGTLKKDVQEAIGEAWQMWRSAWIDTPPMPGKQQMQRRSA